MTRRPRLTIAALAVAVSLGLSGCGSSDSASPGPREAAAVVGGRTITVGEVQEGSVAVNAFVKERGGQLTVTPKDVLGTLIVAPQVLELAERAKAQVPSEAAVRTVLTEAGLPAPDSAVHFIQAESIRQQLGQSELATVNAAAAKDGITVNPRYGTFDKATGLGSLEENWLEPLPVPEGNTPAAPEPGAPPADPTPAPAPSPSS